MIAGNRLANKTKIGYSAFNCGESVAYNLFYTYFLLFMTDFAGVNPAVGGTIALIAVLWDGVTDAVIGYFSDRSTNPNGRRRPFMSRFMVPFAIMLVLIFADFGLTGPAQVAFYVIMNILFWLFFTLTDVPAITLGGEITDDPEEKRSIRSWATIMNYLGFLLATAFAPQMVTRFNDAFNAANPSFGWTATAACFAALLLICYIIAVVSTKGCEKPLTKEEAEKTSNGSLFSSMFATLKVKPFVGLWLYCLIFQAAVFLCTSTLIYVIFYVCNGTENTATVVFLLYGVATIILSPIMDRVARKINNKKGIVGAMILMGGLEVIFGLTVFNTVTLVIMMLCGVAVGMSAYYVLAYTMVYDVAEVASLKLGKDSSTGAGTFIAFFQCAQKIGGAIGMWFAGIMLSFYKYDPNNITEYTVNGIRFIATTLPGIVCIVSGLLILVLYKMNPDDYRKLSGMVGKDELTAEEQALVDRTL